MRGTRKADLHGRSGFGNTWLSVGRPLWLATRPPEAARKPDDAEHKQAERQRAKLAFGGDHHRDQGKAKHPDPDGPSLLHLCCHRRLLCKANLPALRGATVKPGATVA